MIGVGTAFSAATQLNAVSVLAEGEKKGLYWEVGTPLGLTSSKLLTLVVVVYLIGLFFVVVRPQRRRAQNKHSSAQSVVLGDTDSGDGTASAGKPGVIATSAMAVLVIALQFLGCLIVLLIANRVGGFFASFEDLFGAPGA